MILETLERTQWPQGRKVVKGLNDHKSWKKKQDALTDDTAFRQGCSHEWHCSKMWPCVWWGRPPTLNCWGVFSPKMKMWKVFLCTIYLLIPIPLKEKHTKLVISSCCRLVDISVPWTEQGLGLHEHYMLDKCWDTYWRASVQWTEGKRSSHPWPTSEFCSCLAL